MKTPLKHASIFAVTIIICICQALNAQNPGIECGCETYDDYKPPASEAIYIQQLYELQATNSKTSRYRVEVSDAIYPNIVTLTIYRANIQILNVSSRAIGWGFSPDEDYFVMHGFDIHNKHWYILYDLDPDPTVEGEPAIERVNPGSSDVSSARLRFSPHGKYLLYAAIGNNGNLVMYIYETGSGDIVYHPIGLIVGSPSGESVAGWGFSPDERDRTFVHAMLSNANTYTLLVKNLEKPMDEFVLQAPGLNGGANFRFSPCGDYFLWTWEDAVNDPTCYFYKTSEKNLTPDETGSGIGMKKAYTKADGHYIKYFNGDVKIFENDSDDPCPDSNPPSWGGASLSADAVTGTRIDLSWDAATDSKAGIFYKVYQDGIVVKELENHTQVQVAGLTPETQYSFKVEAGDESGNWSSNGPSLQVTTLADNPPIWISGTLIASDVHGVKMTLSWAGASDDNDTELSYRVYVDGIVKKELFGTNSYTLKGLVPQTSYTLKVEAGDEAGQWTTDGPVLVQTTEIDNPPTWPAGADIYTDSITETTLAFHWPEANDVWGVTQYELYRDDALIKTLKSYETNFQDEGLKGGTVYTYKIKAGDEAGNWSAELIKDIKTMSPFVELPLVTGTGTQSLPDIFEETVVWQDTRDGNADIYTYDLVTEAEVPLITDVEWQGKPVVSGKRIVWADARNGNSDIYMHDPWHGTVVICDAPGEQTIPQIDGMYIVWADFRSGDWDIYMFSLETLQETAVCTATGRQTNPDISKGVIVWEDHRHGNPDIYGYKIYNGEEFEVCKHDADQMHPVVESFPEYRIIWQDLRHGDWDLYLWTPFLDNTWTQRIYLGISNQTNPHIADGQLVYQDDKDGSLDIHAYKFYNKFYGDKIPVCTADGDQVNPRTSKGRIVWEDRRNDGGDIYIWDRPPGTDLALELTEVTDPIAVGKTLKYILTATNLGPDDEDLAEVVCTLPIEAEFSDTNTTQGNLIKNGPTLTWHLGLLESDTSATLEIFLKTYTITNLDFEAQISGTGFDPDPSNNRIQESTRVKLVVGQEIGEGYFPSMVVEPSGIAHLFYAGVDSTVYAYRNLSGLWHYTFLDTISYMQSSDILLDNARNIHVVYSDHNYDTIPDGWLFHSTNEYGGEWSKRIIALSDSGFSSISMGMNDTESIHMLYQQSPGAAFNRPFYYMNMKSDLWNRPAMFAFEGYDHIDMVLDDEGHAHAAYIEINKGPVYRESMDSIIGNWYPSGLIEQDWGGGQLEGMVLDIGLDSLGDPHIVYPGNVGDDYLENIKYAYRKNDVWYNELVDIGDFGSGANAIVVEPSGVIHMAYIHFPTNEVRYATNIAGPWIKQTLDEDAGGWLKTLDMGRDDFNNIHIVYETDAVKYIRRPPIQYFTVDPDTLDFGSVKEDSTKTAFLRLYNPGSGKITIDSARVLEGAGFMVHNFDITLFADMEDSIAVDFTPEVPIRVETYLRIFFNGASQMFMDIPVKASTPAPELTVTPDPMFFGFVGMGNSETKSVTLTNSGTEDLVINNIEVKFAPFGTEFPTDFDLVGHDCSLLAPGEDCSVDISLTPSKTGSYTSYLHIYSNDMAGEHKQVTLTGYTSMAMIGAEFTQYDFGYQELNQTATTSMKIYNNGQLDLNITNTLLSGTNSGSFDFRNTCTTILPGDSCEMEIDFTPTSSGDYTATLNIYSNSLYSNPFKIYLNGNSSWRELTVDPSTIDFGLNDISAQDSMVIVTLTNTGTEDLMITNTLITGVDLYEFSSAGCSGTLAAGESCNDTVYFTPIFPGSKQAALRVVSTDSDDPTMDVILTGTAYAGELLSLSGSIMDADGLLAISDGSIELYAEDMPLPITQKEVDGSNLYSFSNLNNGIYTVRFNPDTLTYPDGLPTYLGNVLTLADASFIHVNSDETGQDIHMLNKPADGSGEGEVNGYLQGDEGLKYTTVVEGSTDLTGVAMEGVFVYLKEDGTGRLAGFDVTDGSGYFDFTGLDDGSYIFIADYLGIPMDQGNPLLNIDSEHDSISIVSTIYNDEIGVVIMTTGLRELLNEAGILLYPNPAGEMIYLRMADGRAFLNNSHVRIQDLNGKLVMDKVMNSAGAADMEIGLSGIGSGVYILSLSSGDRTYMVRLTVIR